MNPPSQAKLSDLFHFIPVGIIWLSLEKGVAWKWCLHQNFALFHSAWQQSAFYVICHVLTWKRFPRLLLLPLLLCFANLDKLSQPLQSDPFWRPICLKLCCCWGKISISPTFSSIISVDVRACVRPCVCVCVTIILSLTYENVRKSLVFRSIAVQACETNTMGITLWAARLVARNNKIFVTSDWLKLHGWLAARNSSALVCRYTLD